MCFSVSASFGASGFLFASGILTLLEVNKPSQIFFASIPFIFSIQQLTEGVLWTSLNHSEFSFYQPIATNIFLFMGGVVWPTWVPLSIFLMEPDYKRKKILGGLLLLGIIISSYFGYYLSTREATSGVINQHIHYVFNFPYSGSKFFSLFYLLPTIVSLFLSTSKKVRFLGSIILFSFLTTKLFYHGFIFSVWCFFAAIVSVGIYFIVKEKKSELLHPKNQEVLDAF